MKRPAGAGRGGFALGDAAVLLSLLCLAAAVLYPRIRRTSFEERVALAIADVDALRASARAHREREGTWPADAPAGAIPGELVEDLPAGYAAERRHHTVDWNLWERVRLRSSQADLQAAEAVPASDTVPAGAAEEATPGADTLADAAVEIPPARPVPAGRVLAGITVYSEEAALLAALLERYGPRRSFLREGDWTLILEAPG